MHANSSPNNDGDGGCSFIAAYRRANGSSPWALSDGRRPSGAVLHSSREPGAGRPSSDFMDKLRRLINCRIHHHYYYCSCLPVTRREMTLLAIGLELTVQR